MRRGRGPQRASPPLVEREAIAGCYHRRIVGFSPARGPLRAGGEVTLRGKREKARLILGAKLVLAAALLYWLLRSGALDFARLAELRERWGWFALANAPYLLAQLVAAARWRLLLRVGSIDYPFRPVLELTFVGLFFNQMIFGSTGGDVVRGYAVAVEQPGLRGAAVMSVLVDRALGFAVLLVMVLAAAALRVDLLVEHPDLAALVAIVAAALVAAALATWAFFSRRVRAHPIAAGLVEKLPGRQLFERLAEALEVYGRHRRELWLAALQSLLLHAGIVSMNLCLVAALYEGSFDWLAILLLVPLAHVAMTLPINPPGAIGTAEAIYAYLFGLIGIGQGGLVCVLQRLILYAWALPGGLVWALRRRRLPAGPAAGEA